MPTFHIRRWKGETPHEYLILPCMDMYGICNPRDVCMAGGYYIQMYSARKLNSFYYAEIVEEDRPAYIDMVMQAYEYAVEVYGHSIDISLYTCWMLRDMDIHFVEVK